MKRFMNSVLIEMKKVSWPKRKELIRLTVTVLVTVIFFTCFFALVDIGISELIRMILN